MKKSSTSLFAIRIRNLEHDVLVLKGSSANAASALLTGKICLSIKDHITMKKMNLRLVATIKIQQSDVCVNSKGQTSRPINLEKKLYEHTWDNIEINQYLDNMYENTANNSSTALSKSSTNLKSLGGLRSISQTNLSSMYNHTSGNSSQTSFASTSNLTKSHTLLLGNYEFPFSAILPGNIPESVEGLPGVSVIYRLEASIDKGKLFHNNIIARKRLRVIRTLTTDAVELSESVAVDNTWPGKVEYSLNVPTKAVSIGSTVPISFMLVPLLKGLRLGKITIQLIELYSYVGYIPPAYSNERIIVEKSIKKPDEDDPNFQLDKWEINHHLRLPTSLAKVTQDCDIEPYLKVRHKLKFTIGLINPDGHVSELRASLPLQLFISPFVQIVGTHDPEDDEVVEHGHHSRLGDTNCGEDILFNSPSSASLNELASGGSSTTSFQGLIAPPVYEKHIYDKLWLDFSPIESPVTSGTATPQSIQAENPEDSADVHQLFSMLPIDSQQLSQRLGQLSIQRQSQENAHSTDLTSDLTQARQRATFNLDGDASDFNNIPSRSQLSSLMHRNQLTSPTVQSPPMHLSRVNSLESLYDKSELSKVPSYSQAMKTDAEDDLSPPYVPPLPGSNINLHELNKTFEKLGASTPTNTLKNKPFLSSRGYSSANMSLSSSNNSSPSQSRSQSSLNLLTPSGASLTRTSSKRSLVNYGQASAVPGGSSIPLSKSPTQSPIKPAEINASSSVNSAINMPSPGASNRAASAPPIRSTSSLSLHNLSFINKKKHTKN